MNAVTSVEHAPLLAYYDPGQAYDELLQAGREPRPHYKALYNRLLSLPADEPNRRKSAADTLAADADFWEMLQPGRFTHPTPLLDTLAAQLDLASRAAAQAVQARRLAASAAATTAVEKKPLALLVGRGIMQS